MAENAINAPDLNAQIQQKKKAVISFSDVVPVLDEAIDKSHSTDEFLNIALVSVLSVVVAGVVKNLFKK